MFHGVSRINFVSMFHASIVCYALPLAAMRPRPLPCRHAAALAVGVSAGGVRGRSGGSPQTDPSPCGSGVWWSSSRSHQSLAVLA